MKGEKHKIEINFYAEHPVLEAITKRQQLNVL